MNGSLSSMPPPGSIIHTSLNGNGNGNESSVGVGVRNGGAAAPGGGGGGGEAEEAGALQPAAAAAQTLVRTILGDNAATLTPSSCCKALERHCERLSELERAVVANVEKEKGRRDAMARPLKLLTLKLQTAAKERHAAHKQAAKQEKEMKRLRRQLKDAQDQNDGKDALAAPSKPVAVASPEEQEPAIAIACEELLVHKEAEVEGEGENETSWNLLEDISESPEGPLLLSEEPEENWIEKAGADTDESSTLVDLQVVLKEKERKIEILEEYLMLESGMARSPVDYWEVQLACCATSILPEAMEKMDETLMQLRLQGAKVDIATWNNFMKFWACSGLPDAPEKMEGLVEYMRKECVDPEVGTWNQFMQFWATSGSPEAHEKMEALLQGMADDGVTPDVVTWSIFAKTPAKKAVEKE